MFSSFWTDLEPVTTILGGPDLYIDIGSTINLTCIVKHLPEPPNAILWGHRNLVSLTWTWICVKKKVQLTKMNQIVKSELLDP